MKAVVYHTYGDVDVLKIEEMPTPSVRAGQILVQVISTTVTAADWRFRSASPFLVRLMQGLFKPKATRRVLGAELSGIVKAVGAGVNRFKVGDEIFADVSSCGMGGHAELICLDAEGPVAHKPKGLSFEEAGGICFGGYSALYFLRDVAKIQKGQKLLIIDASGNVGTFAVQLGKYFGAEVTGVCSGKNVELVKSLGADRVIDYTREDFSAESQRYDFIFDTVSYVPFGKCKGVLTERGKLLRLVFGPGLMIGGMLVGLLGKKKVACAVAMKVSGEDLRFLKRLIEDGQIKPMIEKVYPMTEIARAHEHSQSGRKVGSVAVRIGGDCI